MRQGPGDGCGKGGGAHGAITPASTLLDVIRPRDALQGERVLAVRALAVPRMMKSVARSIGGSEALSTAPAARAKALPMYAREGRTPPAKITAIIDRTRCTGCGVCVDFCPERAISLDDTATIEVAVCIGCGACVEVCPNAAITLSDEAR